VLKTIPSLHLQMVIIIITLTSNGGYGTGDHLFPFRTEKLSPVAPMVLDSNPGEQVAANINPRSWKQHLG
jgi:hypothetical protein